MHASPTGRAIPRGARRRLSSRVLTPLVVCGLTLVAGTTAASTISARESAREALDARAGGLHSLAVASLQRTGRPGPAVAATRAAGGTLRTVPADQPLPGGHSVTTKGGKVVYDYTVRQLRLTIALPATQITAATKRALLVTGAAGLGLLLLLLIAVGSALRRAAVRPLRDLAEAVDRMASGQAARVRTAVGSREVAAIGGRLSGLAARLAELESQATTDPLTGAANRRSFQASLDAELKRAARDGRALTLVLIDLDGFKQINDTHGHPFGDGVLQMVAEKLRSSLRATDVVARVGGDEFAVLLPATTRERAASFVQRAKEEAAGAIGGIDLTWSAGVAA
ncbi:MAG: hypothetical protein QOF37_2334, partial [Thermoleophilaceae bacterium]|nr:hypothetical protein [Thermoleophilaceae bacterium]